MKTLLHLDSSGKGPHSVTKPLTSFFVEKWQEANPGGEVVTRDLGQSNLQFVTPELVGAYFTPQEGLTIEQKQALRQSDELVAELLLADEYVFGVPMYNFTVPAVFKAYIDLVARKDKTFSYASGAPAGLLKNKKLTVIMASGGDYSSPQMQSYDFVEPYIRAIMGFLGVTDVTFVRSFGQDPAMIERNSAAAKNQITDLMATTLA